MSYATKENLYERFGKLIIDGLLVRDGGSPTPEEVLDRVQEDSKANIDLYLAAGGYSLPLAGEIPKVLVSIQCSLDLYGLSAFGSTPESVKEGYKQAIAMLEKISKGGLVLEIESKPGGGLEAVEKPLNIAYSDAQSCNFMGSFRK